jgi:serine/threonine-protein kinase
MEVSASTWSAISHLLDQALDLPPPQQEGWLSDLRRREPVLASAVAQLLAAHAEAETADLLDRPPALEDPTPARSTPGIGPGSEVGPYRIERELGAGGMAQVWLAQRSDGTLTRDVALKLPRLSLLRMDLAERFARERDILARLEHPNIARLYDAGVTADGLPYLAMEYVEGRAITEYCDERRLDVRARLALFGQVLAAVQFAHARLVIHRDLKPSNILVNQAGDVRMLDFGIAKLLADDERAHETRLTQMSGRALTPDYASPEQVRGEPLTIATDVYSLGVVLFELLCGQRPYRLKLASAAQLEQAIVEAEPQRPSSAVDAAAAQARGSEPRQLARALAGDLDTIVLKALAKAPAARYGTVAELDDDLQRYRDGRAVRARPPSRWYLARKFVGRHRAAIGGAAAALVMVATAASAAMWQARQARLQAAVALREARHARAAMEFVLDLLRAGRVEQADPQTARKTTAEELVRVGAQRVDERLRDVPEVREQVTDALASMYFEMGLMDEAARLRQKRIELLRQTYGRDDHRIADALLNYTVDLADTQDRTQMQAALAEVERVLDANRDFDSPTRGRLLLETARLSFYQNGERGRRYAERAVTFFREHPDPEGYSLDALRLASKILLAVGDLKAADRFSAEALALAQRLRADAPAYRVAPLIDRANARYALLDIAGAEQGLRAAADLAARQFGPSHVDTVYAQVFLANFLHSTGRREEGRRLMGAAVQALAGGAGASSVPAAVRGGRAILWINEGRLADAAADLDSDIDDLRRGYPGSMHLAKRLVMKAELLTLLGRYKQAEAVLEEATSTASGYLGAQEGHAGLNPYRLAEGNLALARGDPNRALAAFARVSPAQDLGIEKGAFVPDVTQAELGTVSALLQQGRNAEALARARDVTGAIEISALRPFFPAIEADAWLQLAEAERRASLLDAASSHAALALELRRAIDDDASPWLAEAQVALARCLLDRGRRDEAAQWAARAQAIHARHAELGEQFRRSLRDLNARLAGRRS